MTRNHFSQVDAFTNAAMRNTLLLIMLGLTFARPSFAQTKAPEKQTQLAQKSTFIPSVADIVTNYVNAIGGTTAWEKLKTQLAKGTFENDQMGPGSNALEVFKKAPDKWRFTIRGSDGGVMQHGFNGKVGWNESGELEDEQIALFGRLLGLRSGVDIPRFLPTMKLLGKSKVGNIETFVVEAVIIGGHPEKLLFDANNGFLIQEEFGGASLHYQDYKEVDGVKVAYTIRQEGSPNWTIRFKEIRHNVSIDDSKFERPKSL